METQERRRVERIALAAPVTARLQNSAVQVMDICADGFRVAHDEPLVPGPDQKITFVWDGQEFSVDCSVIRSNELLHGTAPRFASGLRVVDRAESYSVLRAIVARVAEREQLERLRTLVEASKLINSSIEPEALYDSILTVARKELAVERGTLYFVDEERREIWAKIAGGFSGEIRLPFGKGIAGTVASTGESVIIHDAYADSRFDQSADLRSGYRTRSMLCVPIRNRGQKIVGVLQLLNKTNGSFGERDLEFLAGISDHMAIAMENARLHLEIVEKQRMERELQLGREIQSRLFPEPPAGIPETEIAARSVPCYEVGGDYYDFLALPDGEFGLAIADVSGKGVSAALIMSSLQAALRVAAPLETSLAALTARLNELVHRSTSGRKYVTFFFGRYHPATGRLRYVNAGHNPPYLVSGETFTPLHSTGRPIGLLAQCECKEEVVEIPRGATLFLYTDGLNEAADSAEEEFGMERLERTFLMSAGGSTAAIPEEVLRQIAAFENGAHATDDKTLVVMRRTVGAEVS
ncbi:MAG TPA: GAF domain-containing SpoIIE family protein phosphatase [Thermoanaerobaculia bacterium]|nr:GAF domain-containing SpoIIE family protein phosphatase [Thermoanaerobaculia bacterium]